MDLPVRVQIAYDVMNQGWLVPCTSSSAIP